MSADLQAFVDSKDASLASIQQRYSVVGIEPVTVITCDGRVIVVCVLGVVRQC